MAKSTTGDGGGGATGEPATADDAAERRDKALKLEALRRQQRGERPSEQQLRAWRRQDKREDERSRWAHYRAIPKKDWREMSGRQHKVLSDQAALYGVPLSGPTIDLPAVVRWLHDFLAEKARVLSASGGEDPLLDGVASPWLEKYREERTLLARMDRLEREKQLLSREVVQALLVRLAQMLRNAGETLEREFGAEANAVLADVLIDYERELAEFAANVGADDDETIGKGV